MTNTRLVDYIRKYPTLSEYEVEVKFLKDTIKNIGNVDVSLEEAEEIWGSHSLSEFATWLGISESFTMKNLYEVIISKDVINVTAKEDIFNILNDVSRKPK